MEGIIIQFTAKFSHSRQHSFKFNYLSARQTQILPICIRGEMLIKLVNHLATILKWFIFTIKEIYFTLIGVNAETSKVINLKSATQGSPTFEWLCLNILIQKALSVHSFPPVLYSPTTFIPLTSKPIYFWWLTPSNLQNLGP